MLSSKPYSGAGASKAVLSISDGARESSVEKAVWMYLYLYLERSALVKNNIFSVKERDLFSKFVVLSAPWESSVEKAGRGRPSLFYHIIQYDIIS